MTIEQTVTIPADHRLIIDIPREVPAGQARILVFPIIEIPKPEKKGSASTPHSDALFNILSGIGEVDVDKIRDERLAKHL